MGDFKHVYWYGYTNLFQKLCKGYIKIKVTLWTHFVTEGRGE